MSCTYIGFWVDLRAVFVRGKIPYSIVLANVNPSYLNHLHVKLEKTYNNRTLICLF